MHHQDHELNMPIGYGYAPDPPDSLCAPQCASCRNELLTQAEVDWAARHSELCPECWIFGPAVIRVAGRPEEPAHA